MERELSTGQPGVRAERRHPIRDDYYKVPTDLQAHPRVVLLD